MAFACRESEGTAGKGPERNRPGNGYPVAGRIMSGPVTPDGFEPGASGG